MVIGLKGFSDKMVLEALFSKENVDSMQELAGLPIRIRFGTVELSGAVYKMFRRDECAVFETGSESIGPKSDLEIALKEFEDFDTGVDL